MRLTLGLCALLLAAPAFAQEEPVEEEVITDPEIVEEEGCGEEEVPEEEIIEEEIGFLPAGRLSRAQRDAPAVFVRLGEAGRLEVKRGEEWKAASLSEYSTWLDIAKGEHDEAMKRQGGTGLEVVGGGVSASRLFVSVRAAPDTPWQHIQWLMTLAAEQKYYKLELSDGKRRMLAFLPVDRGIQPTPQEPPTEIRVAIHLVTRAEEEAKWGDETVKRPTKVACRFGDRETESLDAVGDWIDTAKRAAAGAGTGVVLAGEIRAGHKVPFTKVLDVMEAFADHGLTALNFYGTQIPSPKLRVAPRLPYPVANYVVGD